MNTVNRISWISNAFLLGSHHHFVNENLFFLLQIMIYSNFGVYFNLAFYWFKSHDLYNFVVASTILYQFSSILKFFVIICTGNVDYISANFKISRKCNTSHWSWSWRSCYSSYAEVPFSSTNAKELMSHDTKSCSQEPRKQVQSQTILHWCWHYMSQTVLYWCQLLLIKYILYYTELSCSKAESRNTFEKRSKTMKAARMPPVMH